MKKGKDLTEKAVKKELRGYYYAGVHQYEGECAEDKFVDIVCCDQYGVSYESCYDGWDYIIRKVPDYEDICGMESQIKRLQEQLKDAREVIKIYAETTVGHKQKDGTYKLTVCGGTVNLFDPFFGMNTHTTEYVYDPRPAKKYLKKWGVK